MGGGGGTHLKLLGDVALVHDELAELEGEVVASQILTGLQLSEHSRHSLLAYTKPSGKRCCTSVSCLSTKYPVSTMPECKTQRQLPLCKSQRQAPKQITSSATPVQITASAALV